MSTRTEIEFIFSGADDAAKARRIAGTMIYVYFHNHDQWLLFDDIKPQNADGWIHYPERYVRFEEISDLTLLWSRYRMEYDSIRRSMSHTPDLQDARKAVRQIRQEGNRLKFGDCTRYACNAEGCHQIENLYFEDFFCMYCLIMAAAFPTTSFEGMLRMDSPGTYAKRILTHAVYDRSSLDFEQLEGNPVYHSIILSWVRSDHRLVKRKMSFPAFHVSILADDREAVRQDEEIDQWIRSVNDVEMEMVSAVIQFSHSCDPAVTLEASSRELCIKYLRDLLALLADRGYRTRLFSRLSGRDRKGTRMVIPDNATCIGDKAFFEDPSLQSVEIPDSVTEIGEEAFCSCAGLESVTLPDSVTRIGPRAFSKCPSLKTVTLPRNLKRMGTGLFSGCTGLESVLIPDSVVEIKKGVFSGCQSLKAVTIPESVSRISADAFNECSPGLIIRGRKGSRAEQYCSENGMTFEEHPS